jgi:hypothetical protein
VESETSAAAARSSSHGKNAPRCSVFELRDIPTGALRGPAAVAHTSARDAEAGKIAPAPGHASWPLRAELRRSP